MKWGRPAHPIAIPRPHFRAQLHAKRELAFHPMLGVEGATTNPPYVTWDDDHCTQLMHTIYGIDVTIRGPKI